MGKVLPVGGVQQKLRAACEAGVKEVIIPRENLKEAQLLPSYILDVLRLRPVTEIAEVLRVALIVSPTDPAPAK